MEYERQSILILRKIAILLCKLHKNYFLCIKTLFTLNSKYLKIKKLPQATQAEVKIRLKTDKSNLTLLYHVFYNNTNNYLP